MAKNFGDLLSKSWKEYKVNFRLILKLFLLLVILPSLVMFFFSEIAGFQEKISGGESFGQMILAMAPWFITYGLLILISTVLSVLLTVTLISLFLPKQKKISLLFPAMKNGSKYLLKVILLSIVVTLALVGLFLLLIIPGIIFSVYWAFAIYIMISENKGILDSMKGSKRLVCGRWWKVLGYLILFGLVTIGISIVISIPGIIINLIGGFALSTEASATFSTFVSTIFNLGSSLIVTPLGILFMKNFYTELKITKIETKKSNKGK